MSVHSHPAAHHDRATGPFPTSGTLPEFPQHVVTAVLVCHDGARWLPKALAGLLGQERPVQNALAADTGSADESSRLVTEALGEDRVLHLARRTGFGHAVGEAVRSAPVLTPDELPYLKRPSGWDPVARVWRDENYDLPALPYGEPEQWLWLLHDDCAPEPEALAELLRVVESERELGRETAVVGPKLRGWYDRRQLLEVGVSVANSGRRWTGLDRREQDQGQHDHVREVLSVSSAGMLIRREVFEALGGFDRRLPLMRDDLDLCWRAQDAGHRVLVAPDAVVRHAEAAARERRTVDCAGRARTPAPGGSRRQGASPHRVDKAGAVHTLLVNTRAPMLPWVMLRLLLGTVLRTLGYLVGKVPGQALDEITGLSSVLLRPGRVLAARRNRGRGTLDKGELRALLPPPGATVRLTLEQLAGSLASRRDPEVPTAGRHGGAMESGPGDDEVDFLQTEQFVRLRRIARRPGPLLFAVLLLVSLVACRSLFGGGSLAGGALLPVPDSAGDLWSVWANAWQPTATGSTDTAPPYAAILAALATVFLGSADTAVTLLLVGSVPLAGFAAYFASRPLVTSRRLRAWAAVAYAFWPAATGALATGRIGTAVLAVLLPLLARAGIAASGLAQRKGASGRGSWRATWAYALLLTLATAFTPMVWPLALSLGVAWLVLRRGDLRAHGLRVLAATGTPLLVLAPWSLTLLPFGFFTEAGLGLGAGDAGALDLLGASPGGPGTLGGWLYTGFVLAALAALLRDRRQFAVRVAWAVTLLSLFFAVWANAFVWAGPFTLVQALALLSAGVVGAEGARTRVAAQSFGWRQPVAVLIGIAAVLAPLVSAVHWMGSGADGPLTRRDPVQVPAFVAAESGTPDRPRTLVLTADTEAEVSYALLRGSGARLPDAELTASAGRDEQLDKVVANLVAGSGADQADELGGFAVRYVLVQDGAPRRMSGVLDSTPGLTRLSQSDGSALWQVDRQVARAEITADGETPVPVAAGPVEVHTKVPAGGKGRVLRLADHADEGWTATLDGRPLKSVAVDGWAQGFELPANGGRLDIVHENPLSHTLWLWAQGLLAVTLVVLALPGRRRTVDDDLPEEEASVPEIPTGDGRRARRLRAQAERAEAEAGGAAAAVPAQAGGDGSAPVPHPDAAHVVRLPGQTGPEPAPSDVPNSGADTSYSHAGADVQAAADGTAEHAAAGAYAAYQEPYATAAQPGAPDAYPDPYPAGYGQPAHHQDSSGYDPAAFPQQGGAPGPGGDPAYDAYGTGDVYGAGGYGTGGAYGTDGTYGSYGAGGQGDHGTGGTYGAGSSYGADAAYGADTAYGAEASYGPGGAGEFGTAGLQQPPYPPEQFDPAGYPPGGAYPDQGASGAGYYQAPGEPGHEAHHGATGQVPAPPPPGYDPSAGYAPGWYPADGTHDPYAQQPQQPAPQDREAHPGQDGHYDGSQQ